MPKIPIKYVVEDVDRHGNVRVYYRPPGRRKIRLRGPKGSPEFWEDYLGARQGRLKPAELRQPYSQDRKSLRYLCHIYMQSAVFKGLHPSTRQARRRILDHFCDRDGWGEKPYKDLLPRHIRKRRDAMAETPQAANGMVKAVRQLFKYALEYDLMERNPARDVSLIKVHTDGFHAWTLEEVQKYEAIHPIGTMARLALALALYTGQRRSDLVQLGRQHVQDGYLVFTQVKNRHRRPVRLEIPIIPDLRRILDASPTGDLTFLVNDRAKPFTASGFGQRFRKWCDEAGLLHCSVHGLRKATASRLAELGRTPHEIMAITGHVTLAEVERYTRAANQRTRADAALHGFGYDQTGNKCVPPSPTAHQSGTK